MQRFTKQRSRSRSPRRDSYKKPRGGGDSRGAGNGQYKRRHYSNSSSSQSSGSRDKIQRHHRSNDETGKRNGSLQTNMRTNVRRASESHSQASYSPPQQQRQYSGVNSVSQSQIPANGQNYQQPQQFGNQQSQRQDQPPQEVSSEEVDPDLKQREIVKLFPVQYMTFNHIWERQDLMCRDLTGSGKTLGFCLPSVEYFRKNRMFGSGKPICMILAPTRELALQISKELNLLKHNEREYSVLTVYGGVSIDDQTYALRRGVDFFVGTTGRVKDHIERQNFNFQNLKLAVLDEADQMLHLGFREDVEKIMGTIKQHGPSDLQTLMFSATIPPWVQKVAQGFMRMPFKTLDLVSSLKNKTAKTVEHLAINCPYPNRVSALADILIVYGIGQSIVFTSTKQEANSLLLSEKMKKDVEVMHGDIAQNQREVTLKRFKEKKFSVLVATDVAARGLDIPSVDLVVQVEPPKDTETYIHRSGRTARAGRSGTCITFYTIRQKNYIQMIEQQAGIKFNKIGVPQPEQVIKASFRETFNQLKEVNDDVVKLFEEGADTLVEQESGNTKLALCKLLALVSGHHKQVMKARSLLSGNEDQVTFVIKLSTTFYSVSMVWNLLRKYLPDTIHTQIRGMRAFKDMTGACFDVPENLAIRIEDSINHILDSGRGCDFDLQRAVDLPELKEDDFHNNQGGNQGGYQGGRGGYQGGGGGGYQGRGGYGGNSGGGYQGGGGGYQGRGGYGGDRGGGGGYQSRGGYGGDRGGRGGYNNDRGGGAGGGYQGRGGYGGDRGGGGAGAGGGDRGNQENSVFVGNLGQDADQRKVEQIFNSASLTPLRVRVLTDETGKPKGAAFVDFANTDDAQKACRLDGKAFSGTHPRGLRVNPANNRPQQR